MIVRLSVAAESDLQDGFRFYEARREGLGYYFLRSIIKDLRRLESIAGVHAVFHPPYFRMLIAKFPYAIFYRIEADDVFVDAILDRRRDPAYIANRITNL